LFEDDGLTQVLSDAVSQARQGLNVDGCLVLVASTSFRANKACFHATKSCLDIQMWTSALFSRHQVRP